MVIVSAEWGGGIEEIVVSVQWSVDSNGNSNGEYPISNTQYPIMKDGFRWGKQRKIGGCPYFKGEG